MSTWKSKRNLSEKWNSKNAKKCIFLPNAPNFSNRVPNEKSRSIDKSGELKHTFDCNERGRTYWVLKQTEVINLYFKTKLYGSSLVVKTGSKGNQFAVESIPAMYLYNTESITSEKTVFTIYVKIGGHFAFCAGKNHR